MKESIATHHAASGSRDKKTPATLGASVRATDGLETYGTPASEKRVAPGDASEHTPAESPWSPAKVLGYVRGIVAWTPKNCRYDAERPPKFGLGLNLLFALVSPVLPWECMFSLPPGLGSGSLTNTFSFSSSRGVARLRRSLSRTFTTSSLSSSRSPKRSRWRLRKHLWLLPCRRRAMRPDCSCSAPSGTSFPAAPTSCYWCF